MIVKDILAKNCFGLLHPKKSIFLDNVKTILKKNIIHTNLIATFQIPLKKRIFITAVFINKFLEIWVPVGRGRRKTYTPKSFFVIILKKRAGTVK